LQLLRPLWDHTPLPPKDSETFYELSKINVPSPEAEQHGAAGNNIPNKRPVRVTWGYDNSP